jgi:hypothetical protein
MKKKFMLEFAKNIEHLDKQFISWSPYPTEMRALFEMVNGY